MSNTPNPNRRRVSSVVKARGAELYRDELGNVHTPNGYLPADDYAVVRDARPDLKLPALDALPIR